MTRIISRIYTKLMLKVIIIDIIFQLLMPNGRAAGCPDGQSRLTEVHFTCGVADEISYVQEPSTCIYRFDFTSPAAC